MNINLLKQLNINQMFDKIQMILMMKTTFQAFQEHFKQPHIATEL